MYVSHRFNGPDYDHARDGARLSRQHERVLAVMLDGQPHTLKEIAEATGDPEASVSAQLRHLRKPRFGAHKIVKHHMGNGLFAYQLVQESH